MNRRNHSGAGLFLMEMIAAVFFFMICASVCILAFAKSDRMSRLAKDRGGAVSAAQSAAEIWKAEGISGLQARLKAAPSEAGAEDGDEAAEDFSGTGFYEILWDRNWEPLETAEQARYAGVLEVRDAGDGMWTMGISVAYSGGMETEPLFELEASRYVRQQ